MAMSRRHVKLDSRTARLRLPARHAAYWTLLSAACSLGYRRGPSSTSGVWIAKYSPPNGQRLQSRLAAADDFVPADGVFCFDYTQARQKAMEWFPIAAQISTGDMPRRVGFTVADACQEYLDVLEGRSKSHRTTRYIVNASIMPALGRRLVEKLTRAQVESWHRGLAQTARRKPRHGLAPDSEEAQRRRRDTANRYLVVLKAALNHCLSNGRIAATGLSWKVVAPFRGVGNARTRFLSDTEARSLIRVCKTPFKELVQAALYTGCRYSELASLRVQDFDGISSTLLISQSKSGKPRRVYLDREAWEFFELLCAERPAPEPVFLNDGRTWAKDAAQGLMQQASLAAGISPATFHELRHTAASRWARLGLSLQEISAQLGHADVRMTQRYAHLCQDSLAAKIRALPTLGLPMPSVDSLELMVQ